MRRISALALFICLSFFIASCGGGGSADIEGPTLSVAEAQSLILEQFYAGDVGEDEYGEKGEFSVYLRDFGTGKDIVCLTQDDGMEQLLFAGLYYAGLSVPFREVIGDLPSEAVRFQLVFVEQDSAGCPGPIDDEDDIVGFSKEFGFNDLLGRQIWATNGKAAAVIQAANAETSSPRGMAPSMQKGLAIDKLYFEDGSEALRYHIFVGKIENGSEAGSVEIENEDIAKIRFGGIVYSALGINIDVVDPDSANFDLTKLRFQLYAQRESGTELVGETDFVAVEDLIGERASFTNGSGYLTFRNVSSAPFAASVIRLADLENLETSQLEHDSSLAAGSVLELVFFDPSGSYAVACAGADQGLLDVSSSGSHEVLANLVSVEGQRELFGWNQLMASLVEREDGLSCPKPYPDGIKVVESKQGIAAEDFVSGIIEFDDDGGRVELK